MRLFKTEVQNYDLRSNLPGEDICGDYKLYRSYVVVNKSEAVRLHVMFRDHTLLWWLRIDAYSS